MALSLSQSNSLKQLAQLHARLKIAQLMQMSEIEFQELINRIEDNPLFRRLMYPQGKDKTKEKIISYDRFPGTRILNDFYDFPINLIKDTRTLDLESIIASKERILKIIKNIGIDNFKNYFLYGEFDVSLKELAKKLALSSKEIESIISLVNDLAVKTKFYLPSSLESVGIKYQKIAAIKKEEGKFLIGFLNLGLGRGQYSFNLKKLDQLKNEGVISKGEFRKINSLINKLKVINLRKSVVFRIIKLIITKQKKFLEASRPKALIPLTQKEAASQLNLSASVLNRAIKYKSIDSPWGQELPLRFFFPSLKNIRIQLLSSLIQGKGSNKTDDALREYLQSKHGIYVSRRTINKYKKELL